MWNHVTTIFSTLQVVGRAEVIVRARDAGLTKEFPFGRRGEQVIYYLTEEFRAVVEATGATFRPYQSAMGKMRPPAGLMIGKGGIGPGAMPLMMAHESRQVLPQVLESMRAEQPDYLLYDPMCLWGSQKTTVI